MNSGKCASEERNSVIKSLCANLFHQKTTDSESFTKSPVSLSIGDHISSRLQNSLHTCKMINTHL